MGGLSVVDRLAALGCSVRLDGEKLKVRGPNKPEVRELVSELRRDRDAVMSLLRDRQSKAPTLEEVKSALPPCVRLVSYKPKEAPFAVAPVSVVTNAGKFFRTYLRDLAWRLGHPEGHAAPPLPDILSKLADAGLQVEIARQT